MYFPFHSPFSPAASSEVSFQMVLETGSCKSAQLLQLTLQRCHCRVSLCCSCPADTVISCNSISHKWRLDCKVFDHSTQQKDLKSQPKFGLDGLKIKCGLVCHHLQTISNQVRKECGQRFVLVLIMSVEVSMNCTCKLFVLSSHLFERIISFWPDLQRILFV